MRSYTTLAVLALAASTVSPALSAPVRETWEPFQTRSLSHHARTTREFERLVILTNLAKAILQPSKMRRPSYPPMRRPSQSIVTVPPGHVPPGLVPPGHVPPGHVPPGHVPPAPPSKPAKNWKSKAKALTAEFGIAAAGTLAGDEILHQRPAPAIAANAANATDPTNPAGPANSTILYSTNSTNSNTNGLQKRALVYGKRFSPFGRMLDELD